jgi:hypothetical protein
MAAPVLNTPAHLEHPIKTPDGRTLAVAEWGDPDGLPSYAGSPSRACACTTARATGSPLTGTSNVLSVWGRASGTAKTPGVLTGNQGSARTAILPIPQRAMTAVMAVISCSD